MTVIYQLQIHHKPITFKCFSSVYNHSQGLIIKYMINFNSFAFLPVVKSARSFKESSLRVQKCEDCKCGELKL